MVGLFSFGICDCISRRSNYTFFCFFLTAEIEELLVQDVSSFDLLVCLSLAKDEEASLSPFWFFIK